MNSAGQCKHPHSTPASPAGKVNIHPIIPWAMIAGGGGDAQEVRRRSRGLTPDGAALCCGGSEREKKDEPISSGVPWGGGGSSHSLEAFLERLRDLCQNHGEGDGDERSSRLQHEAQYARTLADELSILKRFDFTWEELRRQEAGLWIGSEHFVDLNEAHRVTKITIPPAFGLAPEVRILAEADLREGAKCRRAIEFLPATPLGYLERWEDANELFGDDVRLEFVVEWADGSVSFGISQPQYHGEPAEPGEIERFFVEAGWTRLKDPSGHLVFFNYAFGVMAIDAERRNCYLTDGNLQPFDVILCRPDEAMERFLKIYD